MPRPLASEPEIADRPDDLLSIADICDRIHRSRETWRQWVKSGQAPGPIPNIPGHPRWSRDDIDRFVRGRFRR